MKSVLQGGLSRRLVTGLNVAGRRGAMGPNMPDKCMAVGLPVAAAAAAAAARNAGPPGDSGLGLRPVGGRFAGDSRPVGAMRAVGLCLLARLTDGSSAWQKLKRQGSAR
jgi:hypothetical protein